MNKNTFISKRKIVLLEIELIVLLAGVLLLGLMFGYSFASPKEMSQSNLQPSGMELMSSGIGPAEDELS